MHKDNYSFKDSLSADEQAVLDHVSGLTSTLPQASGYSCEDRQIVGELMAQREQLSSLAISPPPMKLTFDDLLNRIELDPEAFAALEDTPCTAAASGKPSYKYSPFMWLTSKWGIGFVAMSSIVLTFVVGWLVNRARDVAPLKRYSQFHAKRLSQFSLADGSDGVINQSNVAYLNHPDPSDFSNVVTDRVTNAGGEVTILTRKDGVIQLQAYVPARIENKLSQELLVEPSAFQIKIRRTELASQNLPIKSKLYTEWNWQIQRPERPLSASVKNGASGLQCLGNWLISNGITGSPVLLVFFGFWLFTRRRA